MASFAISFVSVSGFPLRAIFLLIFLVLCVSVSGFFFFSLGSIYKADDMFCCTLNLQIQKHRLFVPVAFYGPCLTAVPKKHHPVSDEQQCCVHFERKYRLIFPNEKCGSRALQSLVSLPLLFLNDKTTTVVNSGHYNVI